MLSEKPDTTITLHRPLQHLIEALVKEFDKIPGKQRPNLHELTAFIREKAKRHQVVKLLFICTHNSRRSHIAQIWAQVAASFYGISGVESYSGATEATAFNPRAVKAMRDAGFKIEQTTDVDNPVYEVYFSHEASPLKAFSKKYDSSSNPGRDFAAVMTCSHADENCPVVTGMERRISLPYNDPKDYDGTGQEIEKYAERVREIGREMLYVFSRVKEGSRTKPASFETF